MFNSKDAAEQMILFLTSPTESTRNQAHNYLLSFQSSVESWEVCRQLMVPSTQEIPLLLSSQIFYKKLQCEFLSLSQSQQQELKSYIFSLVQVPFSSNQVTKKLCQSVVLIGIIGISSFWEDFIISVLRLPNLEIMLEIIDCIPFFLEEFILPKKSAELVKTKLRENIQAIMECLYVTLTEKNYVSQVAQVIKNWRIVHLPIFAHQGLFEGLIKHLYSGSENFSQICDAFTTSVTLSSYAQLFQQSSYKSSIYAYSSQIPSDYLNNLLVLIQALSSIQFLDSQDSDVQRCGSELVISISNNFIFFLLEPVKLWTVIESIVGHRNLTVCMVAIEFFYNFRDALIGVPEIPPFLFEKLLLCTKSLALRCRYSSHDMFFKMLQQKTEDEDVTFNQFRISAEDVFYSIFLVFNKHHPDKGRGFVQHLGGLLDQDEFNNEIFVLMMRSILLGITEHKEDQLLSEVRNN